MRIVVIAALSVAAAACDKTSGQAAGPGAAGGRGARGTAVAIQTTHVQRMSVQREVDLPVSLQPASEGGRVRGLIGQGVRS